jgi:predicted dehydrogenase
MSKSEALAVAVVGVGRMGHHHARIYHELNTARLVAVVDRDPERAQAVACEFDCSAYSSLSELLDAQESLAAVSVVTPTHHHGEAAKMLLPRKISCLIEKPLADSSREAGAIARLAAEHSVICQVGHTERFNPAVRAVSEMNLRPRFIEIDRVAPMSFRSVDVGVVFDLMIHDLDIVLMMCPSALVEVRAVGVGVLTENEDVANARLIFEDGCVANLTVSRLALKTERKLRVFSESVYLTMDFAKRTGVLMSMVDNREALESVRAKLRRGEDLSSLDYMALVKMQPLQMDEEEPLKAELSHFLSCVRDGKKPRVDAEAGRAAVDVAERVVQALRSHHWEGFDGSTLV